MADFVIFVGKKIKVNIRCLICTKISQSSTQSISSSKNIQVWAILVFDTEMGAGQSAEEIRRLDVSLSSDHIQQSNADAHSEAEMAANLQERPTELPQFRMGDKSIDDMRFMISCTNWY